MLSITLGYTIAKSYDVNKVAGAIVSLAAYLMGLPQSASTSTTLTLSDVLPSKFARTYCSQYGCCLCYMGAIYYCR